MNIPSRLATAFQEKTWDLEKKSFDLKKEIQDLEAEIEALKESKKELEDACCNLHFEIEEWKQKPSPSDDYDKRVRAQRYFCYDCHLKDSLDCYLCYLNPYKEEAQDGLS